MLLLSHIYWLCLLPVFQHRNTKTNNKMLNKPISKMWLLYVCLLACLGGCKQCLKAPTPTTLPDATQTGANTFGCMLNGNLWVAQGRSSGFNPAQLPNPYLGYDATYNGGSLDVGGGIVLDDKSQSNIVITGNNIGGTGTYSLDKAKSGIFFKHTDFVNSLVYYNDGYDGNVFSGGELTITKLDKVNKIISGTFYITIEKPKLGKKIVITDGRFDIKYL